MIPRKTKILLAGLLSVSVAAAVGSRLLLCSTPDQEFLLGQKALSRGEWAVVSRQIDRLRQSPGHEDQRHLLRGGLLLRTGELHGAITELARVRGDGELATQSLLLTCEAFYQLKQWSQAEQVAVELLRRQPENPEAHRWLGAIYYDLGAMQQAERHLKTLAQLVPGDYSPHRLLGLIHYDFEHYQDAAADYQRALERQPPEELRAELHRELAKAQAKHNDFEGALKSLDFKSLAKDVEAQTLRAEYLWNLGRKEEALQALRNVQATAPNDPHVLRRVARFALDEGQTEAAIEPLRQIIDADPFDDPALYDLALAYRRVGQTSVADEFMQRRNAVHELVVKMAELSQRAINEPNNAELRDELASVCEQLGKKELAAVWRDAAQALRSKRGRVTPQTP